jgi:hypothetical protein
MYWRAALSIGQLPADTQKGTKCHGANVTPGAGRADARAPARPQTASEELVRGKRVQLGRGRLAPRTLRQISATLR